MALIDRQAAIDALDEIDAEVADGYGYQYVKWREFFAKMPAVDAVEVVRCKNCTHYNAGYECLIDGYGVERDPEWFCGDGERKGR